ncbi:MAG: phenylalanine--tRNA ligase subunit beta [Bacteroidota bacterium]
MKISKNWLLSHIDTNKSSEEISTLLTGCGLEIEHMEAWESLKGGLKNFVVGHILSCEKHPNADKLSITLVDVGDGEPKKIVCGAPNVAAGQKVIVALSGAICYPTVGEPFEIKKSKIRGEESNGMICAEDEIGLGISHAGIMVLPADTSVGMPAADYFQIERDVVFEIGLTPNRADAASHYGVARDLGALTNIKYLKSIDTPSVNISNQTGPIKVIVEDANDCQRYSGVFISNVKVAESPQWLKNKLSAIGIRSINNIVDITNYILHDLGQPLHAFDGDKIQGNTIQVKRAVKGAKFITLDEVDRELSGIELMIADANADLCMAGVFGGKNSGVNEQTKNIFLESAYFNPVVVRKASRHHAIHTDSSFRFERGTDPEMTIVAMMKAAKMIAEIAGGEIAESIIDVYAQPIEWKNIDLNYQYVDTLIGNQLDRDLIKKIITDLGMRVDVENTEGLTLSIPPFKVDVTRAADVVEEIIRIYGYNSIELPGKISMSVTSSSKPDVEKVVAKMASTLISKGYYEILNNSLSKKDTASLIMMNEGDEVVEVLNPLSNDLSILRNSMLLPGLESISYNLNRKQKEIRLFENGKVYSLNNGVYTEKGKMGIWMSGELNKDHWQKSTLTTDIYTIKSLVQSVLSSLGIEQYKLNIEQKAGTVFNQTIDVMLKKRVMVRIGEVNKKTLKQYDINQSVFYAEFDLETIMRAVSPEDIKAQEPPKYPEVKRDLSMMLDKTVNYTEVEEIAYNSVKGILREVNLFDVYEGDKIEAGKKSYALSFILRDDEATLQDKQIDNAMEKLMKQFETRIGAVIRTQ